RAGGGLPRLLGLGYPPVRRGSAVVRLPGQAIGFAAGLRGNFLRSLRSLGRQVLGLRQRLAGRLDRLTSPLLGLLCTLLPVTDANLRLRLRLLHRVARLSLRAVARAFLCFLHPGSDVPLALP